MPEIIIDPADEELMDRLAKMGNWTWGLIYPSGTELREAACAYGIHDTPAGAAVLEVIDPDGVVRAAIKLQPDYMPVFYRQSSLAVSLNLGREWQENHDTGPLRTLSATVYGRVAVRPESNKADYTLWAVIGGMLGECPAHCIDADAIRIAATARAA